MPTSAKLLTPGACCKPRNGTPHYIARRFFVPPRRLISIRQMMQRLSKITDVALRRVAAPPLAPSPFAVFCHFISKAHPPKNCRNDYPMITQRFMIFSIFRSAAPPPILDNTGQCLRFFSQSVAYCRVLSRNGIAAPPMHNPHNPHNPHSFWRAAASSKSAKSAKTIARCPTLYDVPLRQKSRQYYAMLRNATQFLCFLDAPPLGSAASKQHQRCRHACATRATRRALRRFDAIPCLIQNNAAPRRLAALYTTMPVIYNLSTPAARQQRQLSTLCGKLSTYPLRAQRRIQALPLCAAARCFCTFCRAAYAVAYPPRK